MGRQQVLYIAVSVGRYSIARKDTRFLSEGRERGIMSQRGKKREREKCSVLSVKQDGSGKHLC